MAHQIMNSRHLRNGKLLAIRTDIRDWQQQLPVDELEDCLQKSIKNQEASLERLRAMIRGNTETATEFLKRYGGLCHGPAVRAPSDKPYGSFP